MLTDETRRQSFPSLEAMTYLNTAAEGIPPLEVQAALDQYFQDKQRGHEGRAAHTAQREAVKELTARFYGLSAGEIGLTSCSSEAYNLAARALQLGPDDEVIVNDLDFPAGVTPWLPPNSPATVRLWRARGGGLRVEDLPALLTPRTRLLTVSLVSFYNGFRVDLPALIETVRRHADALVAVDVTQALGRIPLDLAGADLIVSSTHKWILASHGGGLVGVPAARAGAWTVPAGGWYNLDNAFGPDRFERAAIRRGAASFSVGMPNYPALYAVRAGLAYIERTGVAAIDAAARPLVLACLEGLRRLPVELITPAEPEHLAGILAFRHPDMEAIDRELRGQRIYIMAQAGRLRISLHGYNTAQDVDRLLGVLAAALHHHAVH
jgi:selenocysteine lyase/cysteine desulfurase